MSDDVGNASAAAYETQGGAMSVTVQQAMDRFVHHRYHTDRESGRMADACMNLLSDYLQFWSGLFEMDGMGMADAPAIEVADWERDLDDKMAQWMQDDTSPVNDLGALTIDQMDEEHLREFVGWYLLKDMALDSNQLRELIEALMAWVDFSQRNHTLEVEQASRFTAILEKSMPESVRAATAGNALQKVVQSGCFSAPNGVEKRPKLLGFMAGMARIAPCDVDAQQAGQATHWLSFDDPEIAAVPVNIPLPLHALLHEGDVLHVYLASYDDQSYRLVDSGPLFPASTWVEAALMERMAPVDGVETMEWDQSQEPLLH